MIKNRLPSNSTLSSLLRDNNHFGYTEIYNFYSGLLYNFGFELALVTLQKYSKLFRKQEISIFKMQGRGITAMK